MLQTGWGFQPDDDITGLGLEQKRVMSWPTVSVAGTTDYQWFDRVLTTVPDSADLMTGVRMTAVNDTLHLGVGLSRRRRANTITAERGQRQLDSLSSLSRDLPPTVRLRDHPHLTAHVSSVTWHCQVPRLTTF